MKCIIKTYFKLFIFLFGISLLLVNCDKDSIEETQIENIPKLTVTIVDFSDVESNKKVFSKIERIIKPKNKYTTNSKDTISNNEYGFIIDTDYVKYVENGNYNSYNFEIIRDYPEDDNLENLLLTLNEDEEYDVFIVKYDFTVEELNSLTQEELENRTSQYIAIDFDSSFLNNKSASRDALECESQYQYECWENPILGIYGFETCGWVSRIVCTGGGGPGPGPNQDGTGTNPITTGGNQGSGSSGGSNTGTYTPSSPYSAPTCTDCLSYTEALAREINITNDIYSANSPFDVDMTDIIENIYFPQIDSISVDSTSTLLAAKKFNCIYRTLKNSDTFKDLFIDSFDDSDRFDVEFKLVPNLPNDANGNAGITGGEINPTTGEIANLQFVINMSVAKINSNSSFDIARTILHESIHIYLKLKLKDCQAGTTLEYLNNLDLDATINEFYADFTCAGVQSQHDFMFNYMLSTFEQCLSEVRDDLVPLSHQEAAEATMIADSTLGINESFDWDNLYYYTSMRGLHNCDSFISEIQNNPEENFRFNRYNGIGNLFSKTSCPE